MEAERLDEGDQVVLVVLGQRQVARVAVALPPGRAGEPVTRSAGTRLNALRSYVLLRTLRVAMGA